MRGKDVVAAIKNGIRQGKRDYQNWSQGNWLSDSGVENIISVKIAEKLAGKINNKDEYIMLEVLFSDIVKKASSAECDGFSRKSRVDIALFTRDDKPTIVIEVKRKWDKKLCLKDLKRLQCLVNSRGSVKRGYLAIFQKNGQGNLRQKLARRKEIVKEHFPDAICHFSEPSSIQDEGYPNWEWAPTCIEIAVEDSK